MKQNLFKKICILCISFLFMTSIGYSQGLENVIVEEYFVNTGASAVAGVPDGAVTYRIFLDLQPGYKLINVFGIDTPNDPGNDLLFTTTTGFYNEPTFGVTYGDANNSALFNVFNGTALDSYTSFGGAANGQRGIQKVNDTDGSNLVPFLGGAPDGYVAGTTPAAAELGVSISGTLEGIQVNGADSLFTFDGSFYVLGGTTTTGPDDVIYIGQFTTDGDFSFRFNIQVLDPNGDPEIYTHSQILTIDGLDSQITPSLTFPLTGAIIGCTDATACNFNEDASLDDETCIFPEENCTICDGAGGLELVDADEDGTCDEDDNCPLLAGLIDGDPCQTEDGIEGTVFDCLCVADAIAGCTSETACNFNPDAGSDDGTCIEPVESCQACNDTNDGLIIIDTDADGICDAEEIAGCTDQTACNFDADATDSDPSLCIEPVENCLACNDTNDGLVIVDTDNDGVCDAEEIAGCTSSTACNFSEDATDDDGSCVEPTPMCLICGDDGSLILMDTDNDGVCNAEDDCPLLADVENGDACSTEEGDGVIVDCECIVEVVFDCEDLQANIGDACDDGDDTTENDMVTADCECVGTPVIVFDCEDLQANIGDACDDGDDTTENDTVTADCECVGTPVFECEADGGAIEFADGSTSVNVCVDDNEASTVDVVFATAPTAPEGYGATWVITDAEGNLLGLPATIADVAAVNFDDAGAGNCLIWFLSFDADSSNVAAAAASFAAGDDVNAADLTGCFELSNSIEVVREDCGSEFDCEDLEANIGDACDDGDADTENDVVTEDCGCEGTPIVIGACTNYVYYLADVDSDLNTDIYGVSLAGSDANLTLLKELDYEAHIAFNVSEGLLYVVRKADGSFATLDVSVVDGNLSAETSIDITLTQVVAAAFNVDDKLIIGDQLANTVRSVNIADGTSSLYTSASVNGGDLAFSSTTGVAYLAARNSGGKLYQINPGMAGQIGTTSELVTGLALMESGNLLFSAKNSGQLMGRNADGTDNGVSFDLVLDGEPFISLDGDLASGCGENINGSNGDDDDDNGGDGNGDNDSDDDGRGEILGYLSGTSTLTSYPNPTQAVSNVVFTTAQTTRTTVAVYDMNGRTVATLFNQEAQAGQEYRLNFDGAALSNGVYVYRLTTDNETIIEKFMIAK